MGKRSAPRGVTEREGSSSRTPTVRPGERYGYRLAVTLEDDTARSSETWVEVPSTPRSGSGRSPPIPRGVISWSRSRSPIGAPARIEMLDIAGRIVRSEEVGRLGPGKHSVDLGSGGMPPPGVYLIRLVAGEP